MINIFSIGRFIEANYFFNGTAMTVVLFFILIVLGIIVFPMLIPFLLSGYTGIKWTVQQTIH